MKKVVMLGMLGGLMLTGCGTGGVTQTDEPYAITVREMGYRFDGGRITITEATVELHSKAGAPDVTRVDYTAVMLNSAGKLAGYKQSTIVPASGTLFGKARGGYVCTTTPAARCTMASPDAQFVNAGPAEWGAENRVVAAIMPWEWATIHNDASMGATENPAVGDTAGWYAQFTFTATQANGKKVTWKQNYQIIAPAG